jgi:CHAT domain-containing protein
VDEIPLAQAEKAPQGLQPAAEACPERSRRAASQFQTGGFNPWASIRRLFIVPHDLLYHLPFHALHDGERYLLERCEVVYLPVASLLLRQTFEVSETLRRTPHSPSLHSGQALWSGTSQGKLSKVSHRALIVGHDHDGRLPAALQEAQAIYELLATAADRTGLVPRPLLGADAPEANLRGHTPDCALLHLATHGVFRQDNPLFSALRLADGWLTLADVERLVLPQAGLVTLSACETGLGDLHGGDLFGLSQAFLHAGAASLVVSLWPVPDEATRRLMIGFYRRLIAGESKAAALRGAQLELMAEPAYRHPLHWAGFVLMGKDGALMER